MASLSVPRPGTGGSSGGSSGGLTANGNTKELFNAALQARVSTNNYITHLKIWENVSEGAPAPPGNLQRKARYLILAVQRDSGRVTLNKAKRNANGSFSIGKDWDLNTLREIVVHDPSHFTLTLMRSYSWETERPKEQALFLQSTARIYRRYMGEDLARCVGVDFGDQLGSADGATAPAPSATLPRSASPYSSRETPDNDFHKPSAIDTQVSRERSRDSPTSASSRRERDGFYSARDPHSASPSRTVQPAIPSLSAGLNGASDKSRPERRPTLQRYASAEPTMTSPVMERGALSASGLSVEQQSVSQGNSPQLGSHVLPPARPARASRIVNKPTQPTISLEPAERQDDRERTSQTDFQANPIASSKSASSSHSTLRPSPARKDSASSIGAASSGGDARARLSSIEPVRGGAAYEKMLLAGTGLTGVAEGDDGDEEEEDPYGGAEIDDVDSMGPGDEILPQLARKGTAKRRHTRINSQDVRDAGEVGNVSSELIDDDEEDTTLANVEEMLEGFEWRHANGGAMGASRYGGKMGKGPADVIEARLLDELAALDAANIHAIIESDDRVNLVVRHIEEALHELDVIDSLVASYKVQLNSRADDINHIEGQNRGLQVHTSNQRALSAEIEKLLSTVQVDDSAVEALLQSEFETDDGISHVERAGAALYKAMLQARRTEEETRGGDSGGVGMAAATERLSEYSALADDFANRLFEYLSQTFIAQTKAVLKDPTRLQALSPPYPTIESHQQVEDFLGRYCGLLLYAKEVSPASFQRISAQYFGSASERYKSEMITLFSVWKSLIAPTSDEEIAETSFTTAASASGTSAVMRSGTVRRTARQGGGKTTKGPGEVAGHEAFHQILATIVPLVAREQNFMADLLHINKNNITFADYMSMEVYFRRRAAVVFGNTPASGPLRDMRSALDLVFGFLTNEFQTFADQAFAKDRLQLIGTLAALDRALLEAEELNNEFLLRTLGKLHTRLASQLDKFIHEQVRAVEQTKLTVKKRKGVTHFIKTFPVFVERVEQQLINSETLNIRPAMDGYYEQICNTMFDALQAMAFPKVDGSTGNLYSSSADEDKGLLNHHVILIENMHHFVKGVGRIKGSGALAPLLNRAQNILDDALSAYVQSALRRPLGKMIDVGDGIDSLLRSTPPNEVSLHSAYNRQAAKRLVKEYSSKDIRKSIEALSKRVVKHFDEDEITTLAEGLNTTSNLHDASGISVEEIIEVLGKVWRSLEDGFTAECERMQRILRECYSNTGDSSKLLCDFTIEDVRRPFASSAPAGRKR